MGLHAPRFVLTFGDGVMTQMVRHTYRPALSLVFALFVAIGSLMAPATAPANTTPPPTCTPPDQMGLVFIIDDSGSMKSNDPNKLAAESVAAAADVIRPGTYMAVSKFSTNASQIVGPTLVDDDNRANLVSSVRTGLIQSGWTYFEKAFVEAKRQLDAMPASVDEKAVIFLSDGVPMDTFTTDQTLGVKIHTYSFGQYADDSVLQDIATRSGGTFTKVTQPAELMPSFIQMTSTMACDTALIEETKVIAPGASVSIPFSIALNVQEFIGTATWNSDKINVEIERPNKTKFDPTTVGQGERLNKQTWYGIFGAVQPPKGTWQVIFTNVGTTSATLGVRISRRTVPLALDCKTVASARSERAINVNWGRSADPRVKYTLSYKAANLPFTAADVADSTKTLTDGLDYGLGAIRVTITTAIRNRRVGRTCSTTVAMPPVPKVLGTEELDSLTGVDFRDNIQGLGGDDTISGLAGPDKLFGGLGNDTISGGDANDTIQGDGGNDTLSGGSGSDMMDGGRTDSGSDTFDGGAGNDRMFGWGGTDTLTGGDGNDSMAGGDGNDTINASGDRTFRDSISCGSGYDQVTADQGRDYVASDCEKITWIPADT